ncbi:hypothetical protein A2U01_0105366, partial [Trifolium medium]|nr:hypothetical protein [Trifolium medium]
MIPAPAPVGPEAPSTKIVHLSAPSFGEAGMSFRPRSRL